MPSDFTVEVPISVKGKGQSTENGKKIGEKIAEQVRKALKNIGVGGESQASNGTGMISRGLGKLTATVGLAAAGIGSLVALLSKASPQLQGILSILGRSFMIFFKPFGDFLAVMLRPLALWLMKMAVAFLKWTRSPTGKTVGEGAKNLVQTAVPIFNPKVFDSFNKFGEWISSISWEAIGQALANFGTMIWDGLTSIGTGIVNIASQFGSWFWEQLMTIWNWGYDFGSWLWQKITSIWNWAMDFGAWLWENLKTIWNWAFDFGGWLWGKITSIWNWSFNFGRWLWDQVTGIFGGSKNKTGSYATGTNFVPETGMYQLHRGEQVLSRNEINYGRGVDFRPVFNITANGMTKDIDFDALARRASRITEMELKSRGIL